MDKYLLDGHKCLWHLDRVTSWLKGERIVPVHIDVGLSKNCNIACHYCFGRFEGTELAGRGEIRYFPREPLLNFIKEAGELGVRSIAFVGEAEPLINPSVYDAVVTGKRAGVDVGLATNGVLLNTGTDGATALRALTWLRFNICSASDEAYRRLQGSKDFDIAVSKIKWATKTKRIHNLSVTIGIQSVLTPLDADQIIPLAILGKEWGVDYFAIKQCADLPDNSLGIFNKMDEYKNYYSILRQAESLSTSTYNVIVKWDTLGSEGKRNYKVCNAVPFVGYASGDGKVHPCARVLNNKETMLKYCMGDLNKQSFKEIFFSERYWEVVELCKQVDDTCYPWCRGNSINEFLWKVTHPPEHVNFI